uniref:uncharacterized protein LOC122597087 n=1 Tax=Erigeron canadensis TaxID=72917 RepID=UPI001CB9D18E|nr:uncharacterized protein LOC122597087 [Erigeron canadensis]
MSSIVDNGSSTRPPVFDKDDFSGWKGRMSLLLKSIDNNMPDILVDGPYVPTSTVVVDAVVGEGNPTIPATVKSIVKDKADWGDEDRRLANLDVKARNFIVHVVPKDIYHSIKMCSTAKKMWGTLTVMFEGCYTSMESTITTLTRRYERFFSLRNESLTDTHTRFNFLVNDLAVVGITKKTDVLKSKFLDSLSPKWNNYISSVKLSSVHQDLDVPGLFESDCDESDGEDLANEVALLAERIRRRSFNKFKGKGRSGQDDKTKKPFDMSKVTCYKCGKSGYMAGDCRSKESSQAVSSKGGRNENYSKLKTKYKALKAQVAELSKKIEKDEKSLIAKDWAESATSFDDEKYKDAKCFMAKEATQKFAEDLARIQQQSELAHKLSRLNRLGDEVLLQKHFNQELKKEISIFKQEVSSKNFTIEKLESEVKAQKQLNAILVTKAKTSEEKFLKIKHITESWCTGSKRVAQCVNVQVPHQVQAIFDGDYDRVIAISEKSGIGFNDLEKIGQTIGEVASESDRVIEIKPEETLDLSKLSITQSVSNSKSKTNNGVSKKNKRKVRDHSVPKEKNKLLKNEKSDSKGNVVPTKSVSSSNDLKFDTDKMIAKYVESRKGKISNDSNLLLSVSDPNIVDQSKLRSECKKSGIGKGFAEKETLKIARKNFKFGKGRIKQQWVSKCDKIISSTTQSESDLMWVFQAYDRTRVSYVNGLKHNLISVSQLCDAGYEVRFRSDKGIVLDLEGNVVLIANRDESLYSFDMRNPTDSKEKDHLGKFDEKANEGILLGYATMMKAYRVYNKKTNTIENSANVTIDEGSSKPDCSLPEDDNINFEELAVS